MSHNRAGCGVVICAAVVGCCASSALALVGTISGTSTWNLANGTACAPLAWSATWDANAIANTITLKQTLRLNAAAGSGAITGAELTDWETKIEAAWNNASLYIVCLNNITGITKTWTIGYDVTLSTTAATSDHTITVHDGTGSTNTDDWFRTGGSGVNIANLNVAAHETGHYLANPDEYTNGGCILLGSPHNALAFTTTSLMNNTFMSTHPSAPPYGTTQDWHYRLWELSLTEYSAAVGDIGNIYFTVPGPGVITVLFGLIAVGRRRRA